MLSIGHRVTGCIITPTLSIMSIAYVTSGSSFADFVKGLEPLYQSPVVWGSLKFLLAFPFAYHSFNGLRHLVSFNFEPICVLYWQMFFFSIGTLAKASTCSLRTEPDSQPSSWAYFQVSDSQCTHLNRAHHYYDWIISSCFFFCLNLRLERDVTIACSHDLNAMLLFKFDDLFLLWWPRGQWNG